MKKVKFYKLSGAFILGILMSVIGSLIAMVVPLLIRDLIDLKNISFNIQTKKIIVTLAAIMLFSIINTAISNYLLSKSGDRRIAEIREDIEKHIINLPLSFFSGQLSGQLASRIINDALIVRNYMTVTVPTALTSIVTIIGTFIILFMLNVKLTFFIIISFSLVIFIAIPIGKINEKLSILAQKSLSELSGEVTESLQNIRSIKLSNAQSLIQKRFREKVNSLYLISLKADRIFAITGPIQTFFTLAVILLVILYGGLSVKEGVLSIGTLVSFLIYLFQVIDPINSLANLYTNYTQAKGATHQLNKILQLKDEKIYFSDKIHLDNIYLKNISFSYNGKVNILKHIDMEILQGERIAFVGPSGSGKTTLINIITRLYPITNGEIFLGNTNVRKIPLGDWRDLFSVVTQENGVISGTIKYNLIFGLDKKVTDKELWQALEIANLAMDVKKMPNQLDFYVGESGKRLSGGQCQRLQIARAILKQAKVLILDEATSNLDSDSEKKIISTIDKMAKDKTVISIAHRLSTVVNADKIYFIENGEILGTGTHLELLKKVPHYRKFVEEQMISK